MGSLQVILKIIGVVDNPNLVPAGLLGKSNAAIVEPNYSLG